MPSSSTGNDRLMVGFNRRFAPLLAEMRARFGPPSERSVTRYLVNAGRLEADSWYLNEELEGSRFTGEGGHFIDTLSWWAGSLPEEVYAVPGPEPTTCRRPSGSRTARPAPSPTSPRGNSRFPKETLDAAAGGRSARLDNFQTGRGLGRAEAGQHAVARRPGQGPAARSSQRFVEACRTGRRCRSRWSPWWPRPGRRSRWREPGERPPGAGVSTTHRPRGSAGMPARGPDVAGRGGLARPRPGAARGVARRQVTARPAGRRDGRGALPAAARRFAAVLPAGHRRARCPGGARAAIAGGRRSAAAGRVGGAGRRPHRPGAARLVPRPGDRPPRPADRYAFRINHRSEEQTGNIKQVWEISRLQHLTLLATAWFLSHDEPYARRVAEPAALLVAGEPVPVRRALDQRHRDRHPADQPGLDPAPAGRLARRRRPVRARRARGAADPLAPAVPRGVPEPRLVGQQPRHRRGGRAARGQLRLPVVPRERALAAARPRACSSAS